VASPYESSSIHNYGSILGSPVIIQNLTNSPADPEVKSISEIKEHLHNLRMELSDDDGFEILRDDFDSVLQKFSTKSTHSYDFLLKGGTKYKEVMFNFCKSMIEEEKFPLSMEVKGSSRDTKEQ
jgi:hypothetical protein